MRSPPLFNSPLLRKRGAALATALLCAAAPAFGAPLPDTDNDGIPDDWERYGHGLLNPAIHNVKVGRPDVVLIAVRRPGLTQAVADVELTQLKAFMARTPTANPDGSTGINLIVVNGPVLPASFANTHYADPALFNAAMPVGWRGIGHGYLMEVFSGGGGQTASPDWSASGNAWQAMAHELGHQFGLQHAPPDGVGVSPLWPSVMNYAYTYSFGGDPNAIQYSTGAFRSNALNENALHEVLYYPIDRVRFLENEGGFRLRSVAANVTYVDWNRNGIFGESSVVADVNDGYSTGAATPSLEGPALAGAPSMATVSDRVFVVYPTKTTAPETWSTSAIAAPSRLAMVDYNGTSLGTPVTLSTRTVSSNPSAVAYGNRLAVAYVSGRLPFVSMWDTSSTGLGSGGLELTDFAQSVDQAILAGGRGIGSALAERLWLLTWSASTKRIRVAEIADARTATDTRPRPRIEPSSTFDLMVAGSPLLSENPIGAAFDTRANRLMVVSYGNNTAWSQVNNLKVSTFRLSGSEWVHESSRWVGTSSTGWWGTTAPTVVLDANNPIEGHSQMNIYIRGGTLATDTFEPMYKIREIGDRTSNDGWRTTLMVDQWNSTQSPPGAALFRGTQVFGLRWSFRDARIPNRLVFYRQTAVLPGLMYDWNEVAFLKNTGFKTSLENMRAYYGL